jgi:hypothetical protein
MPETLIDKEEALDAASSAPPQDAEVAEKDEEAEDPLKDQVDLQKALYELAVKVYGWDKIERREEVLDTRQQRFYFRNVQHIYWNENMASYVLPTAGASFMSVGSSAIDMPRYMDTYNIYTPFGRSIIAAFTQNPPGVRFRAKDPKKAADNTAKAECERYRHYFDQANDNKRLQQDIARLYYTDNRVVTYVRFDESEGREICDAWGVLESKCPMRAKSIKKCPYFIISHEIEVVDAKEDNEDYADKIKPGPSSLGDDYERNARLGILGGSYGAQHSADSHNHLCTEHWIWFRPSIFREAGKKQDKSAQGTVGEELKAIFPDGCFVKFIGDEYCGSKQQSMDSCLEVSFPLPGDGMSRPSMGKTIVPLQDATNDSYNLWKETYDYCIPVTYMNCGMNDIMALREQISEPGNHVPFKKAAGEAMEDQFHTETPAQVSADFITFVQDIRGPFAQFSSGALPSLWGGEMPDQKTASGYAMAREQAMGQMGLPWGSMQRHFAKIYEQAAALAAEQRGNMTLNVEVKGKRRTKIEELSFHNMKGNVLCFPDVDSSFPETYSGKKQSFLQFAQLMGPEIIPWIQTPNNMEVIKDLIGLEDVDNPGAVSCEAQRLEFDKLLAESPVSDEQAFKQAQMQWVAATAMAKMQEAASGQPTQVPPEPQQAQFLKSSVDIDPDVDIHSFHWQEVQALLESPEGHDEKENNPEGWLNTRLHGLAHKKLADQQQAGQAQAKPPNASINFKDLPPEGQMQLAAQRGIQLSAPPPMAAAAGAGAAA